MIDPQEFHGKVKTLNHLLQVKLGVRGKGLEIRLRRAGRRLPRKLQRAGREIVSAERLIGHPKLALLVQPGQIDSAYDALKSYLDRIDPSDRRKGRLLGILAALVFNLLLLVTALILFLRWQGFVG